MLVLMSKAYRCTYGPVGFVWFILQIVVDLAHYKEAEPLLWIAMITQPNHKEILGFILRAFISA